MTTRTRRRIHEEDEDPAVEPEASEKTIWVRSKLAAKPDGGHPVALFDQDAAHPNNGQAYVAGPQPVEVAPTAAVTAGIHAGQLEELSEKEAKKVLDELAEARAKVRADARKATA